MTEEHKLERHIDTSNWRATCIECGCKKMEYFNLKYHCPKCGHILEV